MTVSPDIWVSAAVRLLPVSGNTASKRRWRAALVEVAVMRGNKRRLIARQDHIAGEATGDRQRHVGGTVAETAGEGGRRADAGQTCHSARPHAEWAG